ncbi:MAG: HAMP domain-containing histidine kinase [Clostridia bacterium]|nr:HAMP domain-containing histidine kinase [Clostridia bacterium]
MPTMHNTEVRIVFWTDLAIDAVAGVIVWFLLHPQILGTTNKIHTGAVMGLLCAALAVNLIVLLAVARYHFKCVRRFTDEINSGLHGKRDLQLDEFHEGDFNKLQSAVKDVMDVHSNQEDQLEKEKRNMQRSLDDISHQIKTPLSSIGPTAEEIIRHPEMDSFERKLLLHSIIEQSERIRKLTETLLRISSMDIESVRLSEDTFTVAEWVEEAYEPLQIHMELHDKTLHTQIPPGLTICGDKRLMVEALTNILKNCMEYTPDGGTITVEAEDTAVCTTVVVHDSGMGIAEEDKPHIFKRFYKGKNAHGDSFGIGLNFAQTVIHKMGGDIKPDNHPEGGAMFTIKLNKGNINI